AQWGQLGDGERAEVEVAQGADVARFDVVVAEGDQLLVRAVVQAGFAEVAEVAGSDARVPEFDDLVGVEVAEAVSADFAEEAGAAVVFHLRAPFGYARELSCPSFDRMIVGTDRPRCTVQGVAPQPGTPVDGTGGN